MKVHCSLIYIVLFPARQQLRVNSLRFIGTMRFYELFKHLHLIYTTKEYQNNHFPLYVHVYYIYGIFIILRHLIHEIFMQEKRKMHSLNQFNCCFHKVIIHF